MNNFGKMEDGWLFQNERTLFVVLAVFVWIFIIHTVWTSLVTRRQLQREIDALPRRVDKENDNTQNDNTQHDDDDDDDDDDDGSAKETKKNK
jgi:cell division protein FtsL